MFFRSIKFSFFILLFSLSINISADDSIHIHTGSEDGNYYQVGKSIKKLLERHNFNIEVKTSDGSLINIENILNGKADLAIVQSDTLYKHIKNFPLLSNKIGAIAALFPEYVQVLVHRDSKINKLLKVSGRKLYIGEPKSGSYANAIDLLEQYNIDENRFTRVFYKGKLAEAKIALKKREIDAIIITSSSRIDNDPELKLLAFDHEYVKRLTKLKPYFSYKLINQGFNQEYLVYVRAVLVVRKQEKSAGLPDDLVYDITKITYENWFEIEIETDRHIEFFSKELIARKTSLDVHSAAENYYVEKGNIANLGNSYIAVLIFFSLTFIFIVISQQGMEWRWVCWLVKNPLANHIYDGGQIRQKFWDIWLKITISHGIFMALWIFAFLVVCDLGVISYFEKSYAHELDIQNPFSGKDNTDIVLWLLTFAVTGFNQDIFPNSVVAKISAVIIPVLAVLGAFFLVIHQTIQRDRRHEKHARGEVFPKLKDHIIICGWNNKVPDIINNLVSRLSKGYNHKILVLAEISEEKPLEKFGLDPSRVFFYRGVSSSYKNLRAALIEKSICSIIIADDKKVLSNNNRSLFTVAAINDLTQNKTNYPIIVEAYYQKNIDYFIAHNVKKLICLHSYSVRFLSHAIFNPGVSDILLNLMSFEPPFKLSEATGRKFSIENKTFNDCVMVLRKKNILLLAVHKQSGRSYKALEMDFKVNSCPYITTSTSSDNNTIHADDKLIILENVNFKRNENLQNLSFDAVTPNQETILVIGTGDVANTTCKQIAETSKKTIQLIIQDGNAPIINDCKTEFKGDLKSILECEEFRLLDISRILIISTTYNSSIIQPSIYQDDEALSIVIKLRKYFSNQNTHNADPIHIAAEIKDMENKELFYSVGVNQLIPTNKLTELVISRMVFHEGRVSGFIIKAMSYNDENKLVRIEKWSTRRLQEETKLELIGKNYDYILDNCLNQGIQLIAIETKNGEGKKMVSINPEYNSQAAKVGMKSDDNLFLLISTIRNRARHFVATP